MTTSIPLHGALTAYRKNPRLSRGRGQTEQGAVEGVVCLGEGVEHYLFWIGGVFEKIQHRTDGNGGGLLRRKVEGPGGDAAEGQGFHLLPLGDTQTGQIALL